LVRYSTSQLESAETQILNINDYELPLFSDNRKEQLGKPELAKDFIEKIATSDAAIISFAEHNGSYTVALKNSSIGCLG
jgi:chromate reductase